MKHKSQEDYLRTIYFLVEKNKNEKVKSSDIAEILNVSKAAVSKMLKKMQDEKLVVAKPYTTIFLSKKGFNLAKAITCKYRIIEVFLADILKVKKSDIRKEAHELEHAFSDEIIKKLFKFLQNPRLCPHGKIIPSFNNNFNNKKNHDKHR